MKKYQIKEVENLRKRIDIIKVACSNFNVTKLEKDGDYYLSPCGDFKFSKNRQSFYNKKTKQGGDVFKFIMVAFNLDFTEALEFSKQFILR